MMEYSLMSDAELVHLMKMDDRNAYTEIYHRYKFTLHNHAWNKTRNREEAQDCIQEIFTGLWAKRAALELSSNLSGYLYTTLRNHILNQMLRRNVQDKYIASIQNFVNTEPVIADHLVRENQLKVLIEQEVAALPPRMREVFELSRREHLTHREIAERLGTSEQTVKKQMTNTLRVLRIKLDVLAIFILISNF